MYQWTPAEDSGGHFWFPKALVENMNWAALHSSSKAVFPVLAIHADGRGLAHPGEERIAALAGITDKTAREGLRRLSGFPAYLGSQYYKTKTGKRGRKYHVLLPRKGTVPEDMMDKGQTFPFHRIIIEGGNWAQLLPTAKALYVAMRFFGFFEEYLYQEHEDGDFSFSDQGYTIFQDRRCDFCNADLNQLARYAGIHRNQVTSALVNLIKYHLAEAIPDDGVIYKVYLRPPYIYKTSFLNEQTMQRKKVE